MKKILLSLIILSASLFATITNQELSQELIDSGMPIVDIRTPGEWKETGLIKNSIPIMLFDERGNYNLKLFLEQLNSAVDTKKQFAIICRTGSRTVVLSNFLSQKIKYNVINIKSGIVYAKYKKIKTVPYK
ncbi:MAG: rhodanese-like domain-containing protein [Epsilonproteobacteria bacterium]|nr:MAG: rhodanese-like domain-containing protein [Campylobacterota bacterium]